MQQIFMATYSIIMAPIIGYLIGVLRGHKKNRDANSKGTMLLLRVQLIEYHDRYVPLKSIPSYAYENFMEMYEAYRNLGGNGMITHMAEEVKGLEIRKNNTGSKLIQEG